MVEQWMHLPRLCQVFPNRENRMGEDKSVAPELWFVFHRADEGQMAGSCALFCLSLCRWRTEYWQPSYKMSFIGVMKDKSIPVIPCFVFHRIDEGQMASSRALFCLSSNRWRTNRRPPPFKMSFISRINEPAHLSAGKSSAISAPQFLRKKKSTGFSCAWEIGSLNRL